MAFSPPRDISSTLPEKPENIASSLPAETRIPNNDIHILLNAAGIQYRSPSQNFPVDAFNQVLQTNLTTPFQLSRDIGHYWINQCEESSLRQRSIITIASLLSYQGGLTVPAYSASKGGVAQLVKAFSNEWAKLGIRVNGIAPGYIATDMNEGLINDKVRARQILERIPMGRWGKPEDFKGVVVWLASEKASGFVSGEVVVVDGGWMGR